MKSKKKIFIIALLLLSFIIIFYLKFVQILSLLANILLIAEDPLQKADVLIVISGGYRAERIDRAIKIYKKGYTKKLIFSGGMIYEELSSVDLWIKRAKRHNINIESIFLQKDATSTYEQAIFSAKIMKKNSLKSALLVTSPFHSARAKRIFKKIFDKYGFKVISIPVVRKKKLVDEQRFRRVDIIIEEIIFEIQKTIYYWIAY